MATPGNSTGSIENIDILNNVQTPVFVVDKEGVYHFLNIAAASSFGTTPDEMIGGKMSDFFPSRVAESQMKTIMEAISKGKMVQSVSRSVIRGKERWFESHISPFKEGGKEVDKAIAMDIDVTDRMEGQNDLNDVLKLMNKILRHDLSNFLHFISGSLTLHKIKNDEESLNNAEFYVQKCYELIDNMRNLEGVMMSDEEIKPVEIGPVIEKYVRKFPIDIEVKGDCCCEMSRSFTSVMDNIINNAIKHGDSEKMRIEINSIDDDKCQIRFIDFGKGVPVDIRNIVFKEGFSYGDTKGTGLGLYIVKKLVERSGGKIWIEDNEPTGAVFVIEKYSKCQ